MVPMEDTEQVENMPTVAADILPGPAKQLVHSNVSNTHISVDVNPESQQPDVPTLPNISVCQITKKFHVPKKICHLFL